MLPPPQRPRPAPASWAAETFEAGVASWMEAAAASSSVGDGCGGEGCKPPLRNLRPLNVGNWNDAVAAEEKAEKEEEDEPTRARARERERGRRELQQRRERERERPRWR